MVSAISSGHSALLSSVLVVFVFAGMQLYKVQLGSTQLFTILGGYLGSLVFVFLLTAISNVENHFFGEKSQAQVFPEVTISLLIAMIASGTVHRVCVTTCVIFSLLGLFCINKISTAKTATVIPSPPPPTTRGRKWVTLHNWYRNKFPFKNWIGLLFYSSLRHLISVGYLIEIEKVVNVSFERMMTRIIIIRIFLRILQKLLHPYLLEGWHNFLDHT